LKRKLLTAVLLLTAAGAQAEPILFSGTSGSLSATVSFEVSGDSLTVMLTNTSMGDVMAPSDVLTAVFFDIEGADPGFTPLSALLGPGSTVLFDDPATDVGGEWAYANGLSGAPGGASFGISSVGLNLFGPPDLFGGPNLDGPESPNGLQYGITSAGDDLTTGNTPVTGSTPLIQNSVVFTLGNASGFLVSRISNVYFQYGTSLGEPSFAGNPGGGQVDVIPEPSSFVLLGSAMAGVWMMGRRRRRG